MRSDINQRINNRAERRAKLAKLSWSILEHKCRYYILNSSIISDYDYDILEKEYESICKEFFIPPTACDMVGFDVSRRSCRLVMEKLTNKPKRIRKKIS